MTSNETPKWATNIIHTCLGLRRGEKILIVVDEPLARLRARRVTDRSLQVRAIRINDFLGGVNVATTHIDGVVGEPTLEIDGRIVIDSGEYKR